MKNLEASSRTEVSGQWGDAYDDGHVRMLDGVSALRECLGQIEDSSVVVFSINHRNCCNQAITLKTWSMSVMAIFQQLARSPTSGCC